MEACERTSSILLRSLRRSLVDLSEPTLQASDWTLHAVDGIITSLEVLTAGASNISQSDVSLALNTLMLVTSSSSVSALLSNSSIAYLAAATTSLISTSASLSSSTSMQALSLFGIIAASMQLTAATAGVVCSGLTTLLASPVAQVPAMQAQGISVVASLAAVLNDVVAGMNDSAATTAVRESLLRLVAVTAQRASNETAAASLSSAAVVNAVISAAAALMNTSGSSAAVAGAFSIHASTVNAVLQSVSALVAANNHLGTDSVENLAAAVAVLVSNSSLLTTQGAAAAASLCLTAANSTLGQSIAVVSNLVSAVSSLSSVSTPALNASSVQFVFQLGLVLDVVSTSLAGLLTASNQSSLRVSSPYANISVATITVPSDKALSIENAVVPASTLPGNSTVHSIHYTVSFDPHSGLANSSGVTRLEFRDVNGVLLIQDLDQLITFELPWTAPTSGAAVVTQFWDNTAVPPAYSSYGCVTMPSQTPPLLEIYWDPHFSASKFGDDLQFAWQLSGAPMVGCTQTILNCSDPSEASQLVSLDPQSSIGDPVVGCSLNATGALRVLTGHNCSLWRQNTSGCYWNATYQAFHGAGCVAANATRFATRHLTDFLAAKPLNIEVAKPGDLGNLTAVDFTRMRLLVTVVCILFGIMTAGSFGLSFMDAREKRRALKHLMSPEFGYRVVRGVPVWQLRQDSLTESNGVVRGSAVNMARKLGIPFVRLALAVPEQMLGVLSIQAATGRAHGFSVTGLKARQAARRSSNLDAPHGVTLLLDDAVSCAVELLDYAGTTLDLQCALSDLHGPDVNEIASTALCHAVQLGYCFGDSVDVAHQQRAYLGRLRHHGLDVQQYWHVFSVFCEMLTAGGGLRSAANWWPAARLWRIVLTAQAAGYWDADTGVAPALLASFNDPPQPALRGLRLLYSHVQVCVSLLSGFFAGNSNIGEELYLGRTHTTSRTSRPAGATGKETGGSPDCPLCFSAEAITATVPDALLDELGEPGAATRAWTTCLVLALLPHLHACWCLDNGSGPDSSVTLSDRARAWLIAQLDGDEDLLAQLMSDASSQLALWAVAHDRLLTGSRAALITTAEYTSLLLNRCSGSLVYQLTTKHPTLKVILSTDDFVCARRWESFAMIVSSCAAVLMTAIWLFYSRAVGCCSDVRVALGCDPTAALPCRGFEGQCADLRDTFYRFAAAGIALQERPLPTPLCTAFPDPDSARDQLVSGLISMVVAFPIVGIFDSAFSLSMSTDEAQLHGRTHLKRWSLKAFVLTGRAPWEHVPGWLHRAKLWWAGMWSNSLFAYALVACVSACASWMARVRAFASWCSTPHKQKMQQPVDCMATSSEEQLDQRLIEEAVIFSRVTDAYRRGAVLVLYCCWAVFSYVIVVRTRCALEPMLCLR